MKNASVAKKRIPYGIGDFELIRREEYYYVDKTKIIRDLELHRYPFFIRPRRFGKSLLISTLENYYTGFVRTFYEAIKEGAQNGAISRIFMTGVSPIMLDDMTSGFNIASNITLDREFNEALGFTQADVEAIMNYYTALPEEENRKALEDMKTYYDGYLFHKDSKETLYNPDMVLHFMRYFEKGEYPDKMIDMNVKTDYGKVQRLIREDRGATEDSKIETILEKDEIVTNLLEMFPLERISEREAFISLLFYMGLLTIQQPFMSIVKLKVPNLVIRGLFWEYIYHKVNRVLGDTLDIASIASITQTLAQTGNPREFVSYAYDNVMKYVSNRDLMHFDEKHIKIMLLSFLSMNQVYIPYSELEMSRGYSDIVLVPDSRYGVKNSQIWELKYIHEKENPENKILEAKEQIRRYEKDERFLRVSRGTQLFRYILLAYKDRMDILEA